VARVIFLPRHEGELKLSEMGRKALDYLLYNANYAEKSVTKYQESFNQFLAYLRLSEFNDDVRSFTGDNVLTFAQYLQKHGAKASTVCIRLSGLSTIAKTLMMLKDTRGRPFMTTNPTKTFPWPTIDQAETFFLLPDQLEAFLAVKRTLRESLARDLFIDTGARVGELCRVDVAGVIVVAGETSLAVTVKGRGRKVRKHTFPVSKEAAPAIFEYLMSRKISNPQDPKQNTYPSGEPVPLLLNSRGERWKESALSALMGRIGKDAGIANFRVSSHKLRHTWNVIREHEGMDPWVRSKLLGHSNPNSLNRYRHLLAKDFRKASEAGRSALGKYLGQDAQGES
jgi:site-specific recombinase XerD